MASSIPKKIKLYYFNIKARGEAIRLAFKCGGVPFEDVRVSFEDWKEMKPKVPFGQLPYLEVWETEEQKEPIVLSQSLALLRYAGRLSGLYPTVPVEAAKVDQVLETLEDMFYVLVPSIHEKDAKTKLAMREEIMKEKKLEPWLQGIERLLKEAGGSGFFVGNRLTIAELRAAGIMQYLVGGILDGIPKTLLDDKPFIQKMVAVTVKELASK